MVYLSATLIAFVLYVTNVSLLPHFWILGTQFIFVIPFLSIYSLRDKTIFPYILAVGVGVFYDALTVSTFPYFAVVLLLTTVVGKNFFSKVTSYGVERTGLLLTVIAYFALLLSNWVLILSSYTKIVFYTNCLVSLVVLLIFQFVIYRVLGRYYDWVEKTTTERYR